jgi:hypothetical protein
MEIGWFAQLLIFIAVISVMYLGFLFIPKLIDKIKKKK